MALVGAVRGDGAKPVLHLPPLSVCGRATYSDSTVDFCACAILLSSYFGLARNVYTIYTRVALTIICLPKLRCSRS